MRELRAKGEGAMTLFQKVWDKDPKRNVVFTAIDMLTDPDEIRQFIKEYEDWMLKNADGTAKGKGVETARKNVGYILGYYGDETQKLWYSALPDVSHPIFGHGFGRGKNPTPEEAFKIGVKLGKRMRKEAAKQKEEI
jgi:hypothetical protein